jgi:hypothetical protein
MPVLDLSAFFRRLCFFLCHFGTVLCSIMGMYETRPPPIPPRKRRPLSLAAPQKITRPLLSLMHASDELQSPGVNSVNVDRRVSQ